ncbi:pirin family protein [Pseudonocardia spinosispora]|uniref:pirin family protein n=1 Tax=Pseudonocardia spinosispora TaxID=103441 RepID=UPI000412A4F7|nr:pirin-like bicupin family protein [Pseudonocardia spinosispora]
MTETTRLTKAVDVRRADGRAHSETGWLDSRHSFSFGPHYDPANTHFGVLLVNNDDVVKAGTGFDTHPHRDMEIVTWVLDGSLVHQDSEGNADVVYPGLAQRMSAGTGILHSERNDSWTLTPETGSHTKDVHFVQMWVLPDEARIEPGYEQLDVTDQLDSGEQIVVASGMPKHRDDRAISIHQRDAALYAARLEPGAVTQLPTSPLAHLFIARGSVTVEGTGLLNTGDSARVTISEGQRVTAGPTGAEVLIWEMSSTLG